MKNTLTTRGANFIGRTIEIKWGTSRGQNTYGYTTCALRHQGERIASCNGGGYDMRGTVLGNFLTWAFPDELRAIPLEAMPMQSHWQRAENPRRLCTNTSCIIATPDGEVYLPAGAETCPRCGAETRIDHHDGQTIQDGRSLYGLRFHDPHYNANLARLERADGTFTEAGDIGKTLGELREAGKLVDLDLIRAHYKASSPVATATHTIPSIDGACGESSVRQIAETIGITWERVHDSKKLDVYLIREHTPAA